MIFDLPAIQLPIVFVYLSDRRQRPIDLALSEEMRSILRTVFSITLRDNKLSQEDGVDCPFDEERGDGMLKKILERKTRELTKKIESKELDEKIAICRYFHSPNGCGRGSNCYYSHGEQTLKFEHKPRNLRYNKHDPAILKDNQHRKIFVGGLPSSVDSDDLKKFFEEEFGPVEDAIVIGTKGGGRVISKCFGFITFKQEDTKKMAVKTHFITLSGKTMEIKSIVPKYQVGQEISTSLSDQKFYKDMDEINGGVPSIMQPVKISELPPWLATFKKWLPAYLEKACRRLGEGEWYPLSSLKGDFRATCGMELDHESLGFLKLSDFLRSLPGICRMHVISSGISSPTHMVLQPFYPFPSNTMNHWKHTSSSSPHSPSSKLLSLTNSPSNSELSDITSSSNESALQECVSVEKSGYLDENLNLWMWEPKPHWLVGGSRFIEYNLWGSFGASEQETAAGKGTRQPFSYFVHQWDSGLLGRGYCVACKKSPDKIPIGACPYKICDSCERNLCSTFKCPSISEGMQPLKSLGLDKELPSLIEWDYPDSADLHLPSPTEIKQQNMKNADVSSRLRDNVVAGLHA